MERLAIGRSLHCLGSPTCWSAPARIWHLTEQKVLFSCDAPDQAMSLKWNYSGVLLPALSHDRKLHIDDIADAERRRLTLVDLAFCECDELGMSAKCSKKSLQRALA